MLNRSQFSDDISVVINLALAATQRIAGQRDQEYSLWSRRRRTILRLRLAISLLEVTAAATILAVLMTISVQMLQAVNSQQRSAERRALALATVQAVAEQIGNMPWSDLTAEAAEKVDIPAASKLHLPGAKLSVSVQEEQDPVLAKRVAITLAWNGTHGLATAPLRLTTWVFPGAPLRQER